MYFYERFASEFDSKMNRYELEKRLDIIFNKFLFNESIKKKSFLDVGSGTGWFSKKGLELGADVTSLDVGINILNEVGKKCKGKRVVGSALDLPFPDNVFNFVLATEVIEHTPNPERSIEELTRVLKPGGTLLLTVPNNLWKWSILLANFLKLRPYEGFENWVGYWDIKRILAKNHIKIKTICGFNIIPFFFRFTYPLITFCDRFGCLMSPIMLNIGLKGEKEHEIGMR